MKSGKYLRSLKGEARTDSGWWLLGLVLAGLIFAGELSAKGLDPINGFTSNLEVRAKKISSVLGTENEKRELEIFLKEYDDLNEDVVQIVKRTGAELVDRRPELKRRIERETEGFSMAEPTEPLIFLFKKVTKEDVFRSFREQLLGNLNQVRVILRDNPKEIIRQQWVWYEDYRKDRRAFFCAVQLRDCLKEIHKLARLMNSRARFLRIVRAKLLFEEEFDWDLTRWKQYGGSKTQVKDGRLYIEGSPIMLWTTGKPFGGGCVVSLDYTPREGNGGTILAFPGSPRKGLDYSVSAGPTAPRHHLPPGNKDPMEPYNWGIFAYHVSVHRGRTHLRRTGEGLKMLNVLHKDPCAEKHKRYHIDLLQFGNSFQVIVDGSLVHYYVDADVYGQPLTKGHFGIKQFGAISASYDNIQIHALEGKAK